MPVIYDLRHYMLPESGGYLLGVISKLVYYAKGKFETVWEGYVIKTAYLD